MKKTVILLMSFFAIAMYGQQDPIYTQYMFNTLAVNPAYAGSRDVLSATMLYRHQWIIEGAPRTLTFSADMPVANEKVGLGLVVSNDNIGVFNTLSASANFAYRIRFEKTTLAFGILGGFSQINANLPSTGITNDVMFAQQQNHFVPNVGAGVYWSSDRFYVGASLPKMLNTSLYEAVPNLNPAGLAGFNSRQFRHAFITGGYVFNLSEHVKLKPSTLIRFVSGAPAQLDLNCNLYLYDKFGIGLSARSAAQLGFAKSAIGLFNSPSLLLEWQATEQFKIGYAFDYNTGVQNFSGLSNVMSHEIMLRYEMGFNKAKVLTPRYF